MKTTPALRQGYVALLAYYTQRAKERPHSIGLQRVVRTLGDLVIQDQHADETKISEPVEAYCAKCNATEQGFHFQGGNQDIPICNCCGGEATRVLVREGLDT